MNCPKCDNSHSMKDGFVGGRQRYQCKTCSYRYTVTIKSTAKPKEMKRQAYQMYLEGLGMRAISRVLQVNHVSVQNWIRAQQREAAMPAMSLSR